MGIKYENNTVRKIRLAELICNRYCTHQSSLEACCRAYGVPYITFYQWAQPNVTGSKIRALKYRRGFVKDIHDMYLKAIRKDYPAKVELKEHKYKRSTLLHLKIIDQQIQRSPTQAGIKKHLRTLMYFAKLSNVLSERSN